MNDEYMHSENTVIYIAENIPGPLDIDVGYEKLLNNFNSQLTDHCKCDSLCTMDTCDCLIRSGGENYITQSKDDNYDMKLNFQKYFNDNPTHPFIECNSLCTCSTNCGNRRVQKGPIKTLVVKTCANLGKGKGLFTDQLIHRGTFICEYAGEVITQWQAQMRHHANLLNGKLNYIFCLNEFSNNILTQTIVDPTNFGNIGRYINHSCEPNCCIIPVRVDCPIPKLAIFSQADIPPQSEITFDYSSNKLNPQNNLENLKICLCGSKCCRGFLPNENY